MKFDRLVGNLIRSSLKIFCPENGKLSNFKLENLCIRIENIIFVVPEYINKDWYRSYHNLKIGISD